jgi:hypothetical protein
MVELAASENVDRIRVQVFVRDPHEAPWTATSWHNIGWRRYVASLWNRLFFGTVQSPGIWFQVCPRIFCCSKNQNRLLFQKHGPFVVRGDECFIASSAYGQWRRF